MPHLSVLTTLGGLRASKLYEVDDYDCLDETAWPNAGRFHYSRPAFNDFDGFVSVLEACERHGHQIIIHGEPVGGLPNGIVNRRCRPDPDRPDPPSFRENPEGTSWVMIDIDDLVNKWGKPGSVAEMRALAHAVVCDLLPAEFHRCYFWLQWSAGMAVKYGWDLLKLHLWFMLEKPMTDTALCQWAKSVPGIDPCVFRTVQVNFIARPVFDGLRDPLGDARSGAVKEFGDRETVALEYVFQPDDMQDKRTRDLIKLQQRLWQDQGKRFRLLNPDHVSAPMRKIAEIGVGGRCHSAIVASAASWVVCCGKSPSYEAWAALVRERVALSGNPAATDRSSDRYLKGVWQSAQRRFRCLNPDSPSVPRELIKNHNTF